MEEDIKKTIQHLSCFVRHTVYKRCNSSILAFFGRRSWIGSQKILTHLKIYKVKITCDNIFLAFLLKSIKLKYFVIITKIRWKK